MLFNIWYKAVYIFVVRSYYYLFVLIGKTN